jgi:predicted nucleic acid-binding protein
LILVDTNVLLDLVTDDPIWAEWSIGQLKEVSLAGSLLINDVVYAELSTRYERIEDLEDFASGIGLVHAPMPKAALFLAAKAFRQYKDAGGTKTGVLSDFFIGAHAAVEGVRLLTRDEGRYRTYFPTVELISP